MTNEEIKILKEKYFIGDGYTFAGGYEHRYDPESSAVAYSLIRHFKPTSCLEIGTWYGGSTSFIMAALLKNEKVFWFIASELLEDNIKKTRQNVYEKCQYVPYLVGDITKNLDKVPESLDFLFLDSDHDEKVTAWIVDNIFSRLKEGALVAIHDWAVEDVNGKWIGKGDKGIGGWPETQYLMNLHEQGKLPLEKLYWNWHNPGSYEASFWIYKKI